MAQFAPLKPATILVVEDDEIVLMELAAWLSDIGLIALTASNADEAITSLDAHPEIEVMLTDIEMPGSMDGLRLAHHVRDRWPPLRIIVVSGKFQTQLSELPLNTTFLPKPLDRNNLWRALAHSTTQASATAH